MYPHVMIIASRRVRLFRAPDAFISRPGELLFDAEDKFVELL
jgi:hypothetical protein